MRKTVLALLVSFIALFVAVPTQANAATAGNPISCPAGYGANVMKWSGTKTYTRPSSTSLSSWCLNNKYDTLVPRSHLVWQYNGDLTLRNDSDNKLLWNSGTNNVGVRLVFQNDGNVVIYNSAGGAVWKTNYIHPNEYQYDFYQSHVGDQNTFYQSSIASNGTHYNGGNFKFWLNMTVG